MRYGVVKDEIIATWSKANKSQESGTDKDRSYNVTFIDVPASFGTVPGRPYGLGRYHMSTIRYYFNKTVVLAGGNITSDSNTGGIVSQMGGSLLSLFWAVAESQTAPRLPRQSYRIPK